LPGKGQRQKNIVAALELLTDGDAKSMSDAARRTGASVAGVAKAWQQEHPGEIPPSVVRAQEEDFEGVEPAASGDATLNRRLTKLEASRSEWKAEAQRVRGQLADLEEENDKLLSLLDVVREVEHVERPEWLEPDEDGDHRATLLGDFSDYHIGEVVEPAEMNGYNAYNRDIAEQRVRRFFDKSILLPRTYFAGVSYDGFVLAHLGDTISGDIHDEFRETNELSNYEAVPLAVSWVSEGIERLREEYGKVHVVSVPGNHPRDSRKPRYKKRSAHNADTLIFNLIANEFKDRDEVTFDIPDGISADLEIYNTRFRLEHGDEARGGSGIQGAMLPIALRTHRIRKQAQAEGVPFDVLKIGHWHQLMSLPAKGFMVNGTGKGYDEFARAKGFEPEPPQQLLSVVTPEHGVGMQAPLFVAKRSEEGW
jgi:hypothetical protein